MPAKDTNLLFVRLTKAEKRRIKALAISQGLTLNPPGTKARFGVDSRKYRWQMRIF